MSYDPYAEEEKKRQQALHETRAVVYMRKKTDWSVSHVLFTQKERGSYTYRLYQRQGQDIVLNEDVQLDDARQMIREYTDMGFRIDFDGKFSAWMKSHARKSSGL